MSTKTLFDHERLKLLYSSMKCLNIPQTGLSVNGIRPMLSSPLCTICILNNEVTYWALWKLHLSPLLTSFPFSSSCCVRFLLLLSVCIQCTSFIRMRRLLETMPRKTGGGKRLFWCMWTWPELVVSLIFRRRLSLIISWHFSCVSSLLLTLKLLWHTVLLFVVL